MSQKKGLSMLHRGVYSLAVADISSRAEHAPIYFLVVPSSMQCRIPPCGICIAVNAIIERDAPFVFRAHRAGSTLYAFRVQQSPEASIGRRSNQARPYTGQEVILRDLPRKPSTDGNVCIVLCQGQAHGGEIFSCAKHDNSSHTDRR